jgi:hypothetical protein
MPSISFKAKLFKIGSWTLLSLPKSASEKLPSRGMVMVEGKINGSSFQAPLEPDGKGSHWLKVDKKMLEAVRAKAGDTVTLAIEPSREWPEPVVPKDLQAALSADAEAYKLWLNVTPMARWDWLRWISSTAKSETRQRRIETAFSKLKNGSRRPCCFNRTMCTEPYVSKNGVLLEPTKAI